MGCNILTHHIDGLVQDCSNSIANALELLQSCTKPSIWPDMIITGTDLTLNWCKWSIWIRFSLSTRIEDYGIMYGLPWITVFVTSGAHRQWVTSDQVTIENCCWIYSRVTKKTLFMITHTIFYFLAYHFDITTVDMLLHAKGRCWYCYVKFVLCFSSHKLAESRSSLGNYNLDYQFSITQYLRRSA